MKTLLVFSLLLLGCETDKVSGEGEPVGQLGYSCREDDTCDDNLDCHIIYDDECPGGFGCDCSEASPCNENFECKSPSEYINASYCHTTKESEYETECVESCWGQQDCLCYADSTCNLGMDCIDDICVIPIDEQED